MGFEPTTLRNLVGCSNHWATGCCCFIFNKTGKIRNFLQKTNECQNAVAMAKSKYPSQSSEAAEHLIDGNKRHNCQELSFELQYHHVLLKSAVNRVR